MVDVCTRRIVLEGVSESIIWDGETIISADVVAGISSNAAECHLIFV